MAKEKSATPAKITPVQYLGQVRQEGRKVIWPNRQETTTTTILVMIMVVLTGLFFFVSDFFLRNGVDLFINVFGRLFGGGA